MPSSPAISAIAAPHPVLSVRAISKRFGTLQALAEVSLDFASGQIYALLGENGAGKSTLMNVLNGGLTPDSGDLRIDGEPVRLASPRAARRHGIGMVHQHFTLVEALTVAENLALSFCPAGTWRFDAAASAERAQKFADSIGLTIESADALISELPVGARQRLEILKALVTSPLAKGGLQGGQSWVRILILDEPTAVLTPPEVDQLFTILQGLRERGCTIIFITHKLREAIAIADFITVLRGGRVVGTFPAGALAEAEIAERMIGERPASATAAPHPHVPNAGRLPALRGLRADQLRLLDGDRRLLLDDVTFAVPGGEILGIAGVDGNGQTELFELLAGLRPPLSGTIHVGETKLSEFSPQATLAAGIGRIPPDRQRNGLVLAMSVAENCILNRKLLDRLSVRGLLDERRAREFAETIVHTYSVRLASLDAPVQSLSGGNQQRIVVGRELALEPAVLVTVNPTRGLDIAAAGAVAEALRAAAARGCAVLLISTDIDEVLGLSDTVRVLYRGRLSRELRPPVDVQHLGLLMAGAAE